MLGVFKSMCGSAVEQAVDDGLLAVAELAVAEVGEKGFESWGHWILESKDLDYSCFTIDMEV